MEHYAYSVRNGNGDIRWLCVVADEFVGCGSTEDAAKIDAFDKAAPENPEAAVELGILIGMRGARRSGRPPHGA